MAEITLPDLARTMAATDVRVLRTRTGDGAAATRPMGDDGDVTDLTA